MNMLRSPRIKAAEYLCTVHLNGSMAKHRTAIPYGGFGFPPRRKFPAANPAAALQLSWTGNYIMRLSLGASHIVDLVVTSVTVLRNIRLTCHLHHGATICCSDRFVGTQGRCRQQWFSEDSPNGLGMHSKSYRTDGTVLIRPC